MMPIEIIAPMIVMLTLILTMGGVAILRPISKQLAQFLQVMTQERLSAASSRPREDAAEMRELLSALESRLSLIEERQGFTEALLESSGRSVNGARTVAPREAAPMRRELPTA
jgi:hypothetical protein